MTIALVEQVVQYILSNPVLAFKDDSNVSTSTGGQTDLTTHVFRLRPYQAGGKYDDEEGDSRRGSVESTGGGGHEDDPWSKEADYY